MLSCNLKLTIAFDNKCKTSCFLILRAIAFLGEDGGKGWGVSLDPEIQNGPQINLYFPSTFGSVSPVGSEINGMSFPSLFLRRKCLLNFDNSMNDGQRPSIYYSSLRSAI